MSTNLTTSEMVERVKEDFDAVYDAGYEKGKAEVSSFWDVFQDNGNAKSYEMAFAQNRFDDSTYNPKHTITCLGVTGARHMFYNNKLITDTKVPIDVTNIASNSVLNYAFACSTKNVSKLENIQELRVTETTDYVAAFGQCCSLKSITIIGTIGKTISFAQSSLLTKESILGIYEALSATATEQTCTFNKTAVNAAFTTEEWKALTDAKKNWTFTLL